MLLFGTFCQVALGDIQTGETAYSTTGSDARIHQAIDILLRVPTGRALIATAQKVWKVSNPHDLTRVLKPGTTSRTDAVLTRHYNPDTGLETREREVTVYVRQEQSLDSIVLDMAHEMVHATSRPAWDPYDPELTAIHYIKNAIEGLGGEVQAVQTECQVGLELSKQYGLSMRRCKAYLNQAGEVDPEKIRSDFYRAGKWKSNLAESLGSDIKLLPLLSDETPRLYSSTGNAPYPAALLQEFQTLTEIACANSRKRAESAKGRSIASLDQNSASEFLERRCQ
jgi:hypothetical protein